MRNEAESDSGVLEGKVAMITGGAAGIGYAIASRFISQGCRVVLLDRSEFVRDVARHLGPVSQVLD